MCVHSASSSSWFVNSNHTQSCSTLHESLLFCCIAAVRETPSNTTCCMSRIMQCCPQLGCTNARLQANQLQLHNCTASETMHRAGKIVPSNSACPLQSCT